jgi:hypothetical protein
MRVLAVMGLLAAGLAGPVAAQASSAPAAGIISTVAGGVGGPAQATAVSVGACGVSFHDGTLHVAGGGAVREVGAGDGLTTPAGTGVIAGPLAVGGPAAKADFSTCGAAVDHFGNLVIADSLHYRIAVVAAKTGTFYGQAMSAGDIYSVAGDGRPGYSSSGTAATQAKLSGPADVTVDSYGNLVLADSGFTRPGETRHGSEIQVVAVSTGRFYGQAMTAGDIYRMAGSKGAVGFSGNGTPAIKATLGHALGAIRVDPAGNIVFPDTQTNRVRVIAASTGTFYGHPMKAGNIYTVAGNGRRGFSGDGGPATKTELDHPGGVSVDASGNLVIADTDNNRIRVVAASTGTFYGQAMITGDIYTIVGNGDAGFSGDGSPATSAELWQPQGVALDTRTGNLVIADTGNNRVRVVAGSSGTFYGQPMTARDIYTVAGNGYTVVGNGQEGFSGDGGPAGQAQFSDLTDVAVDGAGNMVASDSVRVRVTAASTGTFYGQAMTARDIYTVAGDGNPSISGDGGPATSAGLTADAVAVDPAGNLVIADEFNHRVRVVAATTGTYYGQAMTAGDIYTVAGDGTDRFSGDGGPATSAGLTAEAVAVDPAGNLVIADEFNYRVRVVAASTGTFYAQAMTAGDIYTVAGDGNPSFSGDGGPATSAGLTVDAVAVNPAGNLVIADEFNNRVRVVAASTGTFYAQAMTAGDIYTVAGDGNSSFSGDGGPATSAGIGVPSGVTVDGSGNLVTSLLSNRVTVVAATTGTFYGVTMTAGNIYTVAGDGRGGFSGDGGAATSAELWSPVGLAVDGSGNLLIADNGSGRVRMVTG